MGKKRWSTDMFKKFPHSRREESALQSSDLFRQFYRDYIDPDTRRQDPMFEIITVPLYFTCTYESGATTRLEFFTAARLDYPEGTNLYIPGMLPNPCAMLIDSIRLYGITSELGRGVFRLDIANKHYGEWPAWALSRREKNLSMRSLFIPPMCHFRASIQWSVPVMLSRGFDGAERSRQPIQVLLRGDWYRPIQ